MYLLLFLSLLAYELIIGFTILALLTIDHFSRKTKVKGEANLLTIFSTNSIQSVATLFGTDQPKLPRFSIRNTYA